VLEDKENKRKRNIKIAAVVIFLFLNGFAQLKKWNDKKANK
jgi:hypothetical protein|tara:strand:+ start:480 stop:602 length:123 start_codon:yes stop_codon:yes gene_type:complete